jgi:hypothetical protein
LVATGLGSLFLPNFGQILFFFYPANLLPECGVRISNPGAGPRYFRYRVEEEGEFSGKFLVQGGQKRPFSWFSTITDHIWSQPHIGRRVTFQFSGGSNPKPQLVSFVYEVRGGLLNPGYRLSQAAEVYEEMVRSPGLSTGGLIGLTFWGVVVMTLMIWIAVTVRVMRRRRIARDEN